MLRTICASALTVLGAMCLCLALPGAAVSQPHQVRFSPLSSTVIFDGLNHTPLGSAQLDVVGDDLVVSNLQAGDGGVLVQLGEARGWGFTFDDLDIQAHPVGAFKQWVMRGMVDGVPDQVTWIERHEVAQVQGQNVIQVSFDTSALGATLNVLELYDDGQLVYDGVHPNGPLYHFFAEEIDPPPMKHQVQWDATCVKMPIDPRNWPVKTASGEIIREFDTIVTYPLDPTRQVSFCSAVESRAAGVSEITLRDEVLVALSERLAHRTLGDARFNPVNGVLGVTQLGSAGDGGVAIDLVSAESVDVRWQPLDPMGVASAGATLKANAYGTLQGVPNQSLGSLGLTLTPGGSIRVDADFTNISSPTQRIQVFDGGQPVVDLPGHTGVAARVSGWPEGLGKLGGQTECYVGEWPPGTEFDIDGIVYVGDELRVLAEGVSATVEDKSRFEIRAGGLGSVNLVEEVLDDGSP